MTQRSKSQGGGGGNGGAGSAKRRPSRPHRQLVAPPDAQWKFHGGFWWWWAPGQRSWVQTPQGEAPVGADGTPATPGSTKPAKDELPKTAWQRLEDARQKEQKEKLSNMHRAAEAAKIAYGPLDTRTVELVEQCDDVHEALRATIGKAARVEALTKEAENIASRLADAVVAESKANQAHQKTQDLVYALEARRDDFSRRLADAEAEDTTDSEAEGCAAPPPFDASMGSSGSVTASASLPSSAEGARVGALEQQVGSLATQMAALVAALQSSQVAAAGGLAAAIPPQVVLQLGR